MRKILLLLMVFLQVVSVHAIAVERNPGCLSALTIGAKGDGIHDDTKSIQSAVDSLDRNGGGAIYLGSATYMVSSIRLAKKTSLIGCGNGATIIQQMKGTKGDCVIIPAKSAALRVSNLSIVGNDSNCGLNIENSRGGTENHPYLYTKNIKDNVPQPYKWITIDDVCIYHFETGLNIERAGFNINICNSTFSHNGNGVIMKCTDSSMYNCYVTNNLYNGLQLIGGNNKISNIKSIFNGLKDSKNSAAITVIGPRCQIVNCETQDNFCKGFWVRGTENLFSNCISNTDGYCKKPIEYIPEVRACGFRISALNNSFSNCGVTSYTEKHGAVYHSPVIIDDAVAYYYPDIFSDIKVLIDKDRLLFHEPFRNVQTLTSKNYIQSLRKVLIEDSEYLLSGSLKDNVIKNVSLGIGSLNVLVDFRCKSVNGNIVRIREEDELNMSVENKSLALYWGGQKMVELALDKDAVMDQDDLRLMLTFVQHGKNLSVSLLCYEKTKARGWIRKEIRQEIDTTVSSFKDATVKIGDLGVAVKRMAISNSPMPESVFLPSSNTNRIYDGSIVYVDADSEM